MRRLACAAVTPPPPPPAAPQTFLGVVSILHVLANVAAVYVLRWQHQAANTGAEPSAPGQLLKRSSSLQRAGSTLRHAARDAHSWVSTRGAGWAAGAARAAPCIFAPRQRSGAMLSPKPSPSHPSPPRPQVHMLQALCLLLQLSTIFRVVALYHPQYQADPNLYYPLQVLPELLYVALLLLPTVGAPALGACGMPERLRHAAG